MGEMMKYMEQMKGSENFKRKVATGLYQTPSPLQEEAKSPWFYLEQCLYKHLQKWTKWKVELELDSEGRNHGGQ